MGGGGRRFSRNVDSREKERERERERESMRSVYSSRAPHSITKNLEKIKKPRSSVEMPFS